MKLEPLSEQNAFLGFLRNADDSKILTGFVQELANAIMDYQVRAVCHVMDFNERSIRYRSNKECTSGQETFKMKPRASVKKPKLSTKQLGTSVKKPGTSVIQPRSFAKIPETSSMTPRSSMMTQRTSW